MQSPIGAIALAAVLAMTPSVAYAFDDSKYPDFKGQACAEQSSLVRVGHDAYFLGADGYLMPTRKGQQSPDARYFNQTRK